MDETILKFAESMQHKLDKNKNKECVQMNRDGKGRTWKDCDLFWLLRRLREETLELDEAIYNADCDGIINETADIGNFAMMIHDIVSKLS